MKEVIKRIIGSNGLDVIRRMKMYIKCLDAFRIGNSERIDIHDGIELIDCISLKKKHVYFGYYDIQQFNKNVDKLLVHIVPFKSKTHRDPIEIAYYDLKSKRLNTIGFTKAWSWQQGSRLRWHPIHMDYVLYNNISDGDYVCQIVDILSGKVLRQIPMALYDVDSQFKVGLGVNFSRLQRLRPGYGYNSLPDNTKNENIPLNDGIIKYDLINNKKELIISYEKLAKDINDPKMQHYINHISISPSGDKFMFFHIWTQGAGMRWNVRLYVSDMNGDNLKILEEKNTISHYAWKNNDVLLTTKINREFEGSCYSEYDVNTGERKIIGGEELKFDGHPTFFKDRQKFISDTYSLSGYLQHVFKYNTVNGEYIPMLDIYHNPRMYEEMRCDLHPRLTPDNKLFTIDTVYSKCKRSVLIFKIR